MDTEQIINIVNKSESVPSSEKMVTNEGWKKQNVMLHILIEKVVKVEKDNEVKDIKEVIVDGIWTSVDEKKLDKLSKDIYKLGETL